MKKILCKVKNVIKDNFIKISSCSFIFLLLITYGLFQANTIQLTTHKSVVSEKNIANKVESFVVPKTVDISFDFKYSGIKSTYEDLFQTVALNDGIRLEFTNMASTGSWGIVIPEKDHVPGQASVFGFKNMPSRNVWHNLRIFVKNNELQVYLDGALTEKIRLKGVDYKLNDISIGTGYSNQRPFSGEIKNFSLRAYNDNPAYDILFFASGQLLLLIAIGTIYKSKNVLSSKFSAGDISKGEMLIQCFCSLITAIIIFRSTHRYIFQEWSSYFLKYEYLLFLLGIIIYFWRTVQLKNYSASILFAGLVIFLKSFYIHMSYIGALSDLGCVKSFV